MNGANIHVIAAEIARRVPLMAGEITENNEATILALLSPLAERIRELEGAKDAKDANLE